MLAKFEENSRYAGEIFESSEKSSCKILVLFGTRPEAIKVAPVIYELKKSAHFQVCVVSSSQHTDLLAPFRFSRICQFPKNIWIGWRKMRKLKIIRLSARRFRLCIGQAARVRRNETRKLFEKRTGELFFLVLFFIGLYPNNTSEKKVLSAL